MHIPEYWIRVREERENRDGQRHSLYAWGWSDQSPAQARQQAQQQLTRLRERLAAGGRLAGAEDYYCSERPLRERIIERGPAGWSAADALVTRNRLGNRVLNCRDAWFIDIDLPPNGRGLFAFLRRRRYQKAYDAALADLRGWAAGGRRLRIWATAAGLRALRLDSRVSVAEGLADLRALGADPRYATLCQAQDSYRARLDPKPWRLGLARPPHVIDDQLPEDGHSLMADWLRHYHEAAAGRATCQLIEDCGSAAADPELEALASWHDQHSAATSGRPLA